MQTDRALAMAAFCGKLAVQHGSGLRQCRTFDRAVRRGKRNDFRRKLGKCVIQHDYLPKILFEIGISDSSDEGFFLLRRDSVARHPHRPDVDTGVFHEEFQRTDAEIAGH